jgi:hypothetical protein
MIGREICRKRLKNVKNEKKTFLDQKYGKKLKNVENETQTLFDLEYGEKHSKTRKMRNAHCRT